MMSEIVTSDSDSDKGGDDSNNDTPNLLFCVDLLVQQLEYLDKTNEASKLHTQRSDIDTTYTDQVVHILDSLKDFQQLAYR